MQKVFEPITIGKLTLKNRLVVSAMLTNLANANGSATEAYIAYHEAKAKGGWGLIITEDYPITPNAGTSKTLPMIYNEELMASHAELAERVHAAGGAIFVQLYHAGRETTSGVTGEQPVAPSAIKDPTMPEIPKALTKAEIEKIVAQFASNAYYVKKAGFDGVEIHGASGYLVGEFLSPFSNKRSDEYGGTIRGRAKFAVDIVKAVREKVGPDFPISFRLCTQEYVDGGLTIEETKVVARLLEKAGVNLLHCTQGIYASRPMITPPYMIPRANFVDNAAEIKKVVSIPVVAVGGINDIDLADEILVSGKADMVTMARASLADPNLPIKAQAGDYDGILYCIGCVQGCQGENSKGNHVRCLVNPCTAMETEYDLSPSAEKKNVWIVGGGVSGCYAAIAAAHRGHSVTLFERNAQLGGQWNLAAVPLCKSGFASLVRWQAQELMRLGVELELNHTVTAEEVRQAAPDAVLIATGSVPLIPPISGLKEGLAAGWVVTAHDVLAGRVSAKHNIVVIGGGLVGAETAELLAADGSQVTLVEMLPEIVRDGIGNPKMLLIKSLQNHGVTVMTDTKGVFVGEGKLTVEKNGVPQQLTGVAQIILAAGVRSDQALVQALADYKGEVRCIGDAAGTKNGYKNIQEAFEAGLSL